MVQRLIIYRNPFITVPLLVWTFVSENPSLPPVLWINLLGYGTMRIGNYYKSYYCTLTSYCSSLDIYKEFQEEAYSVTLHPSGLFVLVGFSEKLRLLNILIDDIRVFKEIAIRGCREVMIL